MVDATDQKTQWNLGETIAWIRARDHARVARMWELGEFAAIASALFDADQLRPRIVAIAFDAAGRLRIAPEGADAAGGGQPPVASDVAPAQVQDLEHSAESDPPTLSPARGLDQPQGSSPDELAGPDRILREIMRRVQMGKLRMTMIRAAAAGAERSPVSAAEAQQVELRITEDAVAPVIAWSQPQGAAAGISPWFSRTDVIRAWPELSRKTAAVTAAMLRHLREISTPERPLIKLQALERCLAEVPYAYPEAFKRAWSQLEAARKRGRGKHGPRAR